MEQIFTNPYADVQVSPIMVQGETMSNKLAVQVRADDDTWSAKPSVVSTGYSVITNSEARDCGHDIMTRSPYTWRGLKTHWDGKRYIGYHLTNEKIAQIDTDGEPHPIHLGLMIRNSYDGSSIFGIQLFVANMVCLNQYQDRNRFGYFAIRHTERNWDFSDALSQIGHGAQRAIEIAPRIQALQNTPLTMGLLQGAHRAIEMPKTKWGEVLTALDADVNRGHSGTAYGLFQALTFVSTHQLDGMSTLRVGESVMQWALPSAKRVDNA